MTSSMFDSSWSAVPGPLELLERGVSIEELPELAELLPGATRAGPWRQRWRRLVERIRGLERGECLAQDIPSWIDLVQLYIPPSGHAQLKRSQSSQRSTSPTLNLFGLGFGSGLTTTFGESVIFDAQQTSKVLQVRLLVTATTYVDRSGGSVLRVDVRDPGAGPEHRIVEVPPEATPPLDSDRWTKLHRIDLSAAGPTGQYSWTYTVGRKANWSAGLNLGGIPGVPLDASLRVEVEHSDEFETTFELPYGLDITFYRRTGEVPLAPRCDLTSDALNVLTADPWQGEQRRR